MFRENQKNADNVDLSGPSNSFVFLYTGWTSTKELSFELYSLIGKNFSKKSYQPNHSGQ